MLNNKAIAILILTISGTAPTALFAAGGSVTGDTLLNTVICKNITSGESVTIRDVKESKSWNCAAAGLKINNGDTVKEILSGTVTVADPATGLVAYYPFNGNANDVSGNGNSGTITGATFTADKNGNANSSLHFGPGAFVRISNSPTLEPEHITVAAWVKNDESNSGGTQYILSKGGYDYHWSSYALYANMNFYIADKSWYVPSPYTPTWDTNWHHVVGTFDGDMVRLYMDGVEVGSGMPKTTTIDYQLPTHQDLYIGAYTPLIYPSSTNFDGTIDEVKIWNRALSASEVANLALQPVDANVASGETGSTKGKGSKAKRARKTPI